jgi:hypothetical protein
MNTPLKWVRERLILSTDTVNDETNDRHKRFLPFDYLLESHQTFPSASICELPLLVECGFVPVQFHVDDASSDRLLFGAELASRFEEIDGTS